MMHSERLIDITIQVLNLSPIIGGLYYGVVFVWRLCLKVGKNARRVHNVKTRITDNNNPPTLLRSNSENVTDRSSNIDRKRRMLPVQTLWLQIILYGCCKKFCKSRTHLHVAAIWKIVVLGGFCTLFAYLPRFGLFSKLGLGPGTQLFAIAILVFFMPEICLYGLHCRRHKRIARSLPDALDILVICVEAGSSLDAALVKVSKEIALTSPDLAKELALTSAELGLGSDRRLALLKLAERCNVAAMHGVINTLTQAEKYGTPITQSLRVFSDDLRSERLMRAEEKAARLPAILTVPMIIFILPALFIVLVGPAAVQLYQNL